MADYIVVVGNLGLSYPLVARRVANAKDRGTHHPLNLISFIPQHAE